MKKNKIFFEGTLLIALIIILAFALTIAILSTGNLKTGQASGSFGTVPTTSGNPGTKGTLYDVGIAYWSYVNGNDDLGFAFSKNSGNSWSISTIVTKKIESISLDRSKTRSFAAAYISPTSSKNDLYYAYSTNGSNWSSFNTNVSTKVAAWPSIRYDPAGNPAMSYTGGGAKEVWYATYNGGSWTHTLIANDYALRSALAFDKQGYPIIAYYATNNFNYELHVARFNGTAWTNTIVDTTGADDRHQISIDVDAKNGIGIVYYSYYTNDLKFAYLNGTKWGTAVIENVNRNNTGFIKNQFKFYKGFPQVIYYDFATSEIKYASNTGNGWSVTKILSIGYPYPKWLSFDISNNGTFNIAYFDLDKTTRKDHLNIGQAIDGRNWNFKSLPISSISGYQTAIATK